MNWVRSLTSSDGVCQLRWANKKAEVKGLPLRISRDYSGSENYAARRWSWATAFGKTVLDWRPKALLMPSTTRSR